ncbi:9392_t:CDS:10 [Paraglomus occultum]|uniref:9392_t:CDS:1 n=1 Tax=Paraglomus occultum TaxID=144539 RepID=A0A9N9A6E2_9GLOM|nr:9392_t:CDS:10 [Paraglomus occultum]
MASIIAVMNNPYHDREPRRLDLQIIPREGLGLFRLGVSIWDIINSLREQTIAFPTVDCKYSEESPLTDLFLSLPANGINLRFDGSTQRLKSIEIYDFSRLRLTYAENEISSSRTKPTAVLVYKKFGPTFRGEFEISNNEYTLNYPGISFIFPIPKEHSSLFTPESSDLPLELPGGTSPLLTRLYIYQGSNFRTPSEPVLIRSTGNENIGGYWSDAGEVESVIAELKKGITVYFFPTSNMTRQSTEILLNVTTPQDLLVEIGPPLRIFYKEDDQMKIHSEENGKSADFGNHMTNAAVTDAALPSGEDGQAIDYFYNYFHLGFDVLFDGSTHRCKKVVLNGNVPGHYDFQRYKRCPYKILVPSNVASSISDESNQAAQLSVEDVDENYENNYIAPEMKIEEIQQRLGGPFPGRPLILNRGSIGQNPFGPTELNGYDGAVFEVMKNHHIATVTLF